MCVRIFQLFQFQVAYRIKQMACVYDCVLACVLCVCACAWQMVAHIRLIALAAKGLMMLQSEPRSIVVFLEIVDVLYFQYS